MLNLKGDSNRKGVPETGIPVRAQWENGEFDAIDIAWLTKESLLKWLRADNYPNPRAENVVGLMLGHGFLDPEYPIGFLTRSKS